MPQSIKKTPRLVRSEHSQTFIDFEAHIYSTPFVDKISWPSFRLSMRQIKSYIYASLSPTYARAKARSIFQGLLVSDSARLDLSVGGSGYHSLYPSLCPVAAFIV